MLEATQGLRYPIRTQLNAMSASIFTQIIRGDLPARFVWQDARVVAFLAMTPLKPGHVLVVPRKEVDHWIDLEPELLDHLMAVAQSVARAIHAAVPSVKVGLVIAGVEVRHVHVHLVPIDAVRELNFDRQERDPDPARLDDEAERIRSALRSQGHSDAVPS